MLDKLKAIHIPGSLIARWMDTNCPIKHIDVCIWAYLRSNSYLRGHLSNFYSVTELALVLKKSKPTIRESLKRLRKFGFIEDELYDHQMRRSRFVNPYIE